MAIYDRLTRENLSGDASSFIGRRREVSAVRRLLSETRLLTLTGAGGVGKTRLALRAADSLSGSFRDGVVLVELAKLEDAALVESTVAAALDLGYAGADPMAALVDYLAGKRMLLVLDNCEHLLESCANLVARLLRGAPRLRILATSRQTLGVYGEQVLAVPTLSVPDPGEAVQSIAKHEAVRLLVDRAASVRKGFVLDASNAVAVARLSQRLDGIPLAIELAAVRLRALPVEQVMRELDERFEVPVEGSPSALPRHQTLRATMDWSFELCSPAEQRLWSRLSMFAGGFDLETVEAVCSGEGIPCEDVFDLVAGLVDKSVLVGERVETGMRYRMLECIREYGRQWLSPSDEQVLRRRYIDHYRDLIERLRVDRIVSDQMERFRLLHWELPNVRVALELCLSDPLTVLTGLASASAMWSFWLLDGSLSEGRYWLERGLELVPEPGDTRVTALWVVSMLALRQGDPAAAKPRLEECESIARRTGDEPARALAIRTAGVAEFSAGDPERGLSLLEEALAFHRAADDIDSLAFSLYYAAAYGSALTPARAAVLGEELLALAEDHHALVTRGYAQFVVAIAVWNLGDRCRVEELMREDAEFRGGMNDRWGLTQCLELLAWTACARGAHERATWLLGAAHSLWQTAGSSPTRLSYHAHWHEQCKQESLRALGKRAFTATFRAGAKAGVDQAVTYAISDD